MFQVLTPDVQMTINKLITGPPTNSVGARLVMLSGVWRRL